jgi:uncharacterized protein
MDKQIINKIIKEISMELKSKYDDFRGIYLFGSYSRNTNHDDSDCDIAILFDKKINWDFKDEIRGIVFEYELNYDIIFDVHIFNLKDIIEPITPLGENIKNEGIFYEF